MDNSERKNLILTKINTESSLHEILRNVENEICQLDAIPFSSRNKVIRIAEDYADGLLNDKSALEELIRFVESVPDKA